MNRVKINNNWEYYEYYDSTGKEVDPKTLTKIMDKDGNVYPVTCRLKRVKYSDMGHVYSAERDVLYVKHPFGEVALDEKSEFYI